MYFAQAPSPGALTPQDRHALEEQIEEERELARDYRKYARRTQNGQLARLWQGYAAEAERRADVQLGLLRGNPGSQGWNQPHGHPHSHGHPAWHR